MYVRVCEICVNRHGINYYYYSRTLFKSMVKCLRFREKREIASLIFAFARGFTWFASGSHLLRSFNAPIYQCYAPPLPVRG